MGADLGEVTRRYADVEEQPGAVVTDAPDAARALDGRASEAGMTVLGTGIGPGQMARPWGVGGW